MTDIIGASKQKFPLNQKVIVFKKKEATGFREREREREREKDKTIKGFFILVF